MIAKLGDVTLGSSMAGAGGGGFMYVLAKSAAEAAAVKDIILAVTTDVKFHDVAIDTAGLVVTQAQ